MKHLTRYLLTLALVMLLIPQLAVGAKAADNTEYAAAASFTPGDTLSGTIEKIDYDYTHSYYKFTMTKGGVFSYTVASDAFDKADVKIYTYNTKDEVHDNNGGNFSGSASLAKGDYYLVIGEYDGAGSFTVSTSVAPAANSANYNDYGNAYAFTLGTNLYGNIGKVSEYDYEKSYYKFTMSKGGVLFFNIESGDFAEADVKIYNAQKQETYDNAGGLNTDSCSLAKGTYYLVIDEYGGTGNYTLHTYVSYAKNSANYNSYTNALKLSIGTAVYGNVGWVKNYEYEKAYYKFTMTNGGEFSYNVSSNSVSKYGITCDTADKVDVKIYNTDRTEVYDNAGGIISGTASLAKGTYYLVIDQYDGTGNYTLKTSVKYAKDSVNNNTFAKARTKTMGSVIYGNAGNSTSSWAFEENYYKLKMAYAGTFKCTMLTSSSVERLYLVIYDSSKKEVKSFWGAPASIALSKGTYYLKVTQSSGTGNYQLKTYARYTNPITVKAAKTSVKRSTSKKQTIKLKVTGAQGKVTYKSSSTTRATVSSKGVVTIKKGAKKGTVTITIKAAGTGSSKAVSYKARTRTVKIKIK